MIEGWEEKTLGDVITLQRGHDLPRTKMLEGSIPVAGSNGVVGSHNEATTQGPGVTIGRSGNVGNAYFYPQDFWAHNTTLYVKDFKGNDPRFVYYFLTTFDFSQFNAGSAVPTLNRNHIHPIDIEVPKPAEQKAIAEILSSLDDKIDLLHRQNATLEALAKAIYRDAMSSSQGWTEMPLSEVTKRITDGAHKSPPTFDEGMPMASVKDMTDWHIEIEGCRKISHEDYSELVEMDCRPLKGDILIAKDGSYLKHVILAEKDMDVVLLSSIAILRPNERIHPMLLAIWLKLASTINDMQYIVSGTVIPRIVLKDFRKFPFPLPPTDDQESLVASIEPLFKKCWANNQQIAALTQLRDTLLPRLMSGAVRVDLGA